MTDDENVFAAHNRWAKENNADRTTGVEGARDKEPSTPKVWDIPEPEVTAESIEWREAPQGVRIVASAALKADWEISVTHARGPYLNADGSLNRIADSIKVAAWKPGTVLAWVATWVTDAHGKYGFESGHILGRLGLVLSPELKTYIKEATQ